MAQLSARGGFLDFSPIKKEDSSAVSYGNKENNSSHPVLSLIQFSRAPFVTFGNVKLGSSKSSVLCIENPVEDANIEVAIDKIASTKGFSVDQTRFTIQPEERVNLTITWTPIEEGGIRELITFIANGVVKHQAILLGRADAPKRRKKSLWDSIKSKKPFDLSDPPRGKKNSVSSLKMAANKTFHVSRTPQYRREKVRSPLASLNKKACTPVEGQKFKQDVLGQFSFDNVQKNSPVVFLVPAAKLIDSSDAAASNSFPVGTPECRDLTRLLNTTVSPVGTPERLQKLMPHIQSIQSPAPVIDDTVANISHTVLAGTPVLSVRDALALIESDLTHVVGASPPNACSSFDFSHSLESANGEKNCGPVKSVIDLKALSESPIKSDPAQPRLTFFIKPKRVTDKEGRVEVGEVVPQSKKVTFTSTTVIKSKPAPVQVRSPGVRRIKTSRRRLLEKTLELSGDSGHSESSPGTTVTPGLPVIDSDANHDSPLTISPREARLESISYSPVCLDDNPAPVNLSLSSPLPMNPPTGGPQHLGLDDSILGATQLNTAPIVEPLPDRAGVFPVYNQSQFDMRVVRSKKRKSDEFLRDGGEKVEDAAEKMFHVKKSRVSTVVKGPNRPAQQKGFSASSHRQQTKTSASVCTSSASSMRAPKSVSPAQAKQPAPKPGQRGAQSLKSFGGSSVKTAKIVAVAQSKLTFTKPGQTAIPRHPMPFAAKNMFYDERWIEKQETGFTWWINYVLTPDDFKVNTEVTKVNAVSLAMGGNDKFAVNKAPTKEEMSFSTYTARRRLNRLRRSACQLFTSEPMVKAIQRLELEVEARRLLVRKDRHLWKDIGERQKVLNWLLSYNPLWLRIGLETIYGEMISLESNSDVMGLAMFILKRLLWNPDIAAEFRHAKVPNLYKDGHEGALSRFTLKKLLLLVCFLDKAKESRMIEHDPCLFCMDAEFKTTKDLLLSFSRDFLSGEGILPRHLGYMGLPVSHVQTPLDEFNFAVKNLSVDLKCGIRLVRVMELFIQDWSLSRKLRMPAISRLQKVHNVDIALQVLRDRGVDLKDEHDAVIDSRDIVDGHREKTLSLLWKIIFTFQVEVLLDEDQLREEISFLKHTWTTKQRLASLRADKGVLQKTPKPRPPFEHSSSKITLLMEWVNAVCQFYHLKAENFTVSFSDGRILCYLIHHYHPSHLPADSVSHNTTQTVECSQRGRVELNSSSSDSDISFDNWPTTQNVSPSMEFKELLENEKNNFRLVNTAVSDLGGVPAMMNPADMSNTIPNEKVVTCYLSFLCARLLDLRNETRAARIIQGAWRKYRLKKDLKLYQERTVAAEKIQVLVRQFLQRRRAVCQTAAAIRIQAAWRGYSARNALTLRSKALLWALQVAAAITIQAQWKKYVTLKNYQRLRLHIVKVQALWRMKMAVTTYRRTQWAATVIQKHVRASTLAREERERYCSLRSAAVKIQRNYRRRKTLRLQRENHAATVIQTAFKKWHSDKMARRTAAALKIQSFYRMRRCLKQYMNTQRSAILIQTWCRGHAQRRNFETLKLQHHSATVIQSAFRASTVRKQMATMRQSSVVIQRWFRASVQRDTGRQQFLKMRCAAVTIQSAYRGHTARRLMQQQNQAATVIQTAFMKFVARRKFLSLKKSAIVVQQRFRAKLVGEKSRKAYMALQYSALRIQAIWRGRAVRKRIEKRHKCATLIQSSYRRHVLQSQFRSRKKAALAIQSHYRAYRAGETIRTDYLRLKKAAVTVQARFRGMRVRQELRQKHQAAAVLQSVVRVFLCRRRYVLLQRAAIVLQCRYRALVAGRRQQAQYSQLKLATVKLQAAYRRSRELRTKHQGATVIQAQLRMHKVRQAYLATKVAAIIVQQHYRANRLRDLQMQRYTSVKSAAVVIQAVYRGHRARMEVARMHHSAMVIQRRFLTFRDRKRFLAVKTAVLLCQQRCRDVAMVRKDQRDYLLKLRAATALQAAFKGMKVRKQLQTECRAAILIQSHVRKHLQRAHYERLHWAVNTVQARYRANKKMIEDRKALRVRRSAVVVLQAAFRGMRSRRSTGEMNKAASVLQRSYRAHCVRRQYLSLRSSVLAIQQKYRAALAAKQQMQHYQRMRSAVILLQAAYRGQRARKEISLQHQAATTIQAGFRKHREEVKFQAMKFAAIIIQRYFRSHIQRKQDRDQFLTLKDSAIVLQAAFRGRCVRQDVAKMKKAASVIQANFRMHKEQVKFHAMRLSAVIIQRYYRSHIQMKRDRDRFIKLRESAIVLQAAFRAYHIRQHAAKMHRAASVIQANFRMHKEQVKFHAMRLSAVIIQRYYRSHIQMKRDRDRFIKLRESAIVLQAAFREMMARKQLQTERRAAILIQSHVRKHLQRAHYKRLHWAVNTVQARYRANKKMIEDRKALRVRRSAVVVLQAAFRGMLSRQRMREMHKTASVLQRSYRAHCVRRQYLSLRSSVLAIQQKYRAALAAKQQMQHYQRMRSAVILLQAAYRGQRARKEISLQHQAATTIQAGFRKHREEVKFQAMKFAAIIIQRYFRSHIQMKQDRDKFIKLRESAIVLQAAFRAYHIRQHAAKMHRAASVIQANFRMHKEQVKFQAMRLSAVIIQRYFRSHIQMKQDRDKLKKCRESAIVLQAAFRGYRVRQDVAKMCRAATVIQANFRMHKEQSAYRRQHWAASVLQQRFRAQRLRNSQLENYHQMRNAVINLQALYRRKQAKELAKQMIAARKIQSVLRMSIRRQRFLKEKAAALLIQSAFRRHQARTRYNKTQASAVTIQRWYRSCNVRRRQRDDYFAIREAAVKLQSAVRGTLARRLARRKRAAVKIQSVIRMSIQRRRYLTLRSSTVKLQSHCRAWVARRRFLKRRTAAATLQKHYRGWQVQREQRCLYLKTLTSVKTLQARVRGHIQLKRYQNLKRSAVTIQAFYRGMVERRRFQHQRASAAIIQERFRAHLLCQRERAKYLEIKKSAVLIQAVFRGDLARQIAKKRQAAVATVHRCMQTRHLCNRFRVIQRSVRVIQCRWRETLKAREERHNFLVMKAAAVTIEASWRGHATRNHLRKEQRAAVLVQSSFRGWVQKRAYQRQREAALVLQRRVRAMQQAKAERVKYTRLKQATITVQAHCRGWIARRQLREVASAERRVRFCAAVYHHLCALRIQRALRSHWALQSAKRQITSVIFIQRWLRARLQRRRYVEDRRRVVVAQRAARSWLARRHHAASTIQHAARTFLLRRREQRVQQGIIKAQALWRGHQSRKLHDNRKVVSMRHRLRKVSEEVREEDRLCNKTSWAIEYLLKYKHFSYILEALKNLETATRLSPECCERLVTSGATLVIFTLIRSCNRSVPSMEVITYAIQVLLNLSKYDKTIEAVYAVENSVDTLLDLLQIYREKAGDKVADKGGSIFTKACFLLIILLQDQSRALEVRKLSKAVDRLHSIYRLTARKHKMDAERTVVKQKMGASINGSFIVPATPRKSKPVPKFSPDWVLRRDKLQDIVDPLRAVQMVADVFSIVL
ncbi:abnormal spindle-like microcephaly-associated protein [Salvelinus namaycush]|uniref:Abnormal spindle-like microcephaly-associated protein n=1 Tax=Salvelinus namaycush TaxID=8040 RepID=A0A8U1ELK4_SALNM|nr:abnormal spindle-like microcephaly-associated protein [Salvelinus namaycush]